jgi:hypothetical protein
MYSLDPLVYFKLKARVLELMLSEQQIQAQRREAVISAGLAPGHYVFDDATTSVTEVTPQADGAIAAPAAAPAAAGPHTSGEP